MRNSYFVITYTIVYIGQVAENCWVLVRYVPVGASLEDIKKHMAVSGTVLSVRIPKSNMNIYNKSALVEYDTKEAADHAVKHLHSSKLGTSAISVFPQNFLMRDNSEKGKIYADRDRNVFVGKLPRSVQDDDLRKHLSACGNVQLAKVLRAPDGVSKCCGIVTFSSKEEAQKAIATLHNSMLCGQTINVMPDNPITQRGFVEPNKKYPTANSSNCIYVTNLHYDADEDSIRELMEVAGPVKTLKLYTEYNGRSKGRAMVEYHSEWDARTALSTLDKIDFFSRKIYLRHCNPY